MKLFLVLIMLLFEVLPTVCALEESIPAFQHSGYCRKKCESGEIYEVACLNGKLCCVSEGENKKHERAVRAVLLEVLSKDTALPRKCFSNIIGYCRKKCEMGEIYEVACLNGKLCCVNEGENKKHERAPKPPSSLTQSDGKMDYVILPTITLLTIRM